MKGRLNEGANIDLGLAVSALSLEYGQTRTAEEIAAYCGCHRRAIEKIEKRALRKLQRAAFLRNDPVLRELATH